jgi:hypothetical protein
MRKCGLEIEQYLNGAKITAYDAERLMKNDIKDALILAQKTFPNFNSQPQAVKVVLVDMCYILGPNKIVKFVNFRTAIDNKDYKTAIIEYKNSKMFTQIGKRGEYCVSLLRSAK